MQYRYRHLTDGQLYGVRLLMQIAGTTYDAVRLSNQCLQRVLRMRAVFRQRACAFAASLAPFFVGRFERRRCIPNTLLLTLHAEGEARNIRTVNELPIVKELEQEMQIQIKRFETELRQQRVVKQIEIEELKQVVKRADR